MNKLLSSTLKVFIVLSILLYLSLTSSCTKNPISPILIETPTDTLINKDTTSHNINWQMYEFGDLGLYSDLADVAIIDENNIWAVGDMYKRDSIGKIDPERYNAVHWDGKEWEMFRIYYDDGSGMKGAGNIRSLLAFGSDDIYFGNETHWNGKDFESLKYNIEFPSLTLAMWGTSGHDFYECGNYGLLAHYNGIKWELINTNTKIHLYDIYGGFNNVTNKQEILLVGCINQNSTQVLLKLEDNKITSVPIDGIPPNDLQTIWFIPGQHYYIGGGRIFDKNNLTDSIWRDDSLKITKYFACNIRGTALNDIFVIGTYGEVVHYNGSTWKSYINETYFNGCLAKMSIKGNLIAVVGEKDNRGVILIGKRIK